MPAVCDIWWRFPSPFCTTNLTNLDYNNPSVRSAPTWEWFMAPRPTRLVGDFAWVPQPHVWAVVLNGLPNF